MYIKAFNGRESRIDTTQGLQKAVKGGYGFFASATLARRTLRTSLIQERCSLKEIEVGQTFTVVALPMEKFSPYEKIINLRYIINEKIKCTPQIVMSYFFFFYYQFKFLLTHNTTYLFFLTFIYI